MYVMFSVPVVPLRRVLFTASSILVRRGIFSRDSADALDPCVWKHVLTHEALARLSIRTDVIRTWGIDEVTYSGVYSYKVKATVHGCGYTAALSKSKRTHNGLRNHIAIKQTRILLLPHWAFQLSSTSINHLKKLCVQPKGAARAHRRSQSLISNTEAPQLVGAGEGANNQDFLADLSTAEVIDLQRSAQQA